MAIQTVKTGAAVNDGTGDDARTAFTKINQNFTYAENAASRQVGTGAGNVMEVGAFGLGATVSHNTAKILNLAGFQGLSSSVTGLDFPLQCLTVGWEQAVSVIGVNPVSNRMFFKNVNLTGNQNLNTGWAEVRSTANTSVDPNGFIKNASPIVSLYADRIELNEEANLQQIAFEKLGVGDYLVKGSTGFAQEGWYIEMPKDANGNVLVAVVYEQLDNNDISVKTYAKMFDPDTGDIVPNTARPRDIPSTRWIDLRLQALPQSDIAPTDNTVNTNAE